MPAWSARASVRWRSSSAPRSTSTEPRRLPLPFWCSCSEQRVLEVVGRSRTRGAPAARRSASTPCGRCRYRCRWPRARRRGRRPGCRPRRGPRVTEAGHQRIPEPVTSTLEIRTTRPRLPEKPSVRAVDSTARVPAAGTLLAVTRGNHGERDTGGGTAGDEGVSAARTAAVVPLNERCGPGRDASPATHCPINRRRTRRVRAPAAHALLPALPRGEHTAFSPWVASQTLPPEFRPPSRDRFSGHGLGKQRDRADGLSGRWHGAEEPDQRPMKLPPSQTTVWPVT